MTKLRILIGAYHVQGSIALKMMFDEVNIPLKEIAKAYFTSKVKSSSHRRH